MTPGCSNIKWLLKNKANIESFTVQLELGSPTSYTCCRLRTADCQHVQQYTWKSGVCSCAVHAIKEEERGAFLQWPIECSLHRGRQNECFTGDKCSSTHVCPCRECRMLLVACIESS